MNNIARSGVFRHLPGKFSEQINIRSKFSGSARIAVSSPFRTAAKNSHAAALETKYVTPRPAPKTIEEQELEGDYEELFYNFHKKPDMKMHQLAKWVNATTFGAASIYAFVGCLIFLRTGLPELVAYVGLLSSFVTAGKYLVEHFSETTSMLKQVPVLMAKMHSRLKAEILAAMKEQEEKQQQQHQEMRTEILAAINESKS